MFLELATGALIYKGVSTVLNNRSIANSTDEKMKISQYRRSLVKRQNAIVFESDEDEAAAEYSGEIQSIIDVIDCYGTIEEIKKAAEWVGEPCPL